MARSFSPVILILLAVQGLTSGKETTAGPGNPHPLYAGSSSQFWQTVPANVGLSDACKREFLTMQVFNEQYEINQMLDAMGKPGSGIFGGHTDFFGDYLGCTNIPRAKYCISSFNLTYPGTTRIMTIRMGVCVPKNCSTEDAISFPENLAEIASPQYKIALAFLTSFFESHNTSFVGFCSEPAPYNPGSIVMLTLISLVICLLIAGTFVDWFFYQPRDELAEQSSGDVLNIGKHDLRGSANGYGGIETGFPRPVAAGSEEATPLIGAVRTSKLVHAGMHKPKLPLDLLRCFSVPRKLSIILAAEHKPGTIPFLHGLRVFSMFWVILGHIYAFALYAGNYNVLHVLDETKRTSFQVVMNGTFSVDTFFFLSGLLVTFLTLKHLERNGGKLNWIMFYVHRYLRLTPLYLFVILAAMYIVPHMGEGPLWGQLMTQGFNCHKYWWTNLLYINNFYPTSINDQCIGWSWYLANDMQFFIISPLVIVAAYHFRGVGVLITTGFLVLVSIVTRSALTSHYHLTISSLLVGAGLPQQDHPLRSSQDVLYTKPYTRIATYAIGMAVGYLIKTSAFKDSRLPKIVQVAAAVAAWALTALFLSIPIFSLTHMYSGSSYLTVAESAAYQTLSRICWALGLALLVLICQSGFGGYVNSLLSHPMWIPLSRLTYGAYLVHPIVLFTMFFGQDNPIYFTDTAMVFYYLGSLLCAYLVSLICAVGVEYPLLELESKLIGR